MILRGIDSALMPTLFVLFSLFGSPLATAHAVATLPEVHVKPAPFWDVATLAALHPCVAVAYVSVCKRDSKKFLIKYICNINLQGFGWTSLHNTLSQQMQFYISKGKKQNLTWDLDLLRMVKSTRS